MVKSKKLELNDNDVIIFYKTCSELPYNKIYSVQHRMGRELLSLALKEIYNIDFTEEMLEFNKNKKPYLVNNPEIHFNISHSKDIVVVAVSKVEIGIDIETVKHFESSFIDRVFSPDEKLQSLKFNDNDEYFTRIWTLKECYFKCLGTGLEFPLTKTSFCLDNQSGPIEFKQNNKYYYQEKIGKNSIFSICLNDNNSWE